VVNEAQAAPVVLRASPVEALFAVFMRVVSGYCLLFGILYWVRLIGLYDGPLWRFDLMPVHWQIAAVTLSVFFPFAAIGLWMLTSWGPVIWFICAATETLMYGLFSNLFGQRLLIVASHGLVALFYLAFRGLIHWQKKQAAKVGLG
jgi:hypothetical protein